MEIISSPRIRYYPKKKLSFKREVKKTIKKFFQEITFYHRKYKKPVSLEFKIVFNVTGVEYMVPAWESLYVYTLFLNACEKLNNSIDDFELNSQLRKRLSGKALR